MKAIEPVRIWRTEDGHDFATEAEALMHCDCYGVGVTQLTILHGHGETRAMWVQAQPYNAQLWPDVPAARPGYVAHGFRPVWITDREVDNE